LPHLLITIAQDYFRQESLFVENKDLLKQPQLHPEKGHLEAVIAEVKPSTVIRSVTYSSLLDANYMITLA
jgi:hypothetical protein